MIEKISAILNRVAFVIFFLGFLLSYIFFAAYFKAFVFSELWKMFLLPLGVPSITVWTSWGIILIVEFLSPSKLYDFDYKKDYKDKNSIVDLIVELIKPFWLSLASWILGIIIYSIANQ